MALEYVSQVTDLFWSYCDEKDKTYLTDPQVALYLDLGYGDFRRIVNDCDPHIFVMTATLTVTGYSYDLLNGAVKLMGPTPTAGQGRLVRLLEVAKSSVGVVPDLYIHGCQDRIELADTAYGYLLEKNLLTFSVTDIGRVVVWYIPVSSVDWTKLDPPGGAAPEFIDEMVEFHDLIALKAYRHYAIRDVAKNPVLAEAMTQREQDFRNYLSYGRSPASNNHVS